MKGQYEDWGYNDEHGEVEEEEPDEDDRNEELMANIYEVMCVLHGPICFFTPTHFVSALTSLLPPAAPASDECAGRPS